MKHTIPREEAICLDGEARGCLFQKTRAGRWTSVRKLEVKDPEENHPLTAVVAATETKEDGHES